MRVIVRMLIIGCLIVAFSIGFTSIQPARAADTTVSTCDFASLSTAVDRANDGGGTIDFACSGTIFFDNELIINADVTINGNAVTFDGGARTRLFVVNRGASLTLNGFTLRNGSANEGGAIYNDSGILTVNDSTLIGNSARARGGAIYSWGVVNINNSVLKNNLADRNGGAIDVKGYSGNLTITNSELSDNRSNNNGGAIDGNTITIINCTRSLVASANCAFVDLQVTISDGDGPFTINYGLGSTSGNPTGVFTFPGPAIFNNVTVTEQGGDMQSISLGSINCYFPLIAYAACSGNDMIVVITAGDGPFTIQYNGLTLPNLAATPHLFTGPGTFTNVAVLEQGGDLQSSGMGNITCP